MYVILKLNSYDTENIFKRLLRYHIDIFNCERCYQPKLKEIFTQCQHNLNTTSKPIFDNAFN